MTVRIVDGHLPEAGSEVDGSKMVKLALPMPLIHSLTSFMEYLSVWVLVLSHTEDWRLVGRFGASDNPQLEPFLQGLFNELLMIGFER